MTTEEQAAERESLFTLDERITRAVAEHEAAEEREFIRRKLEEEARREEAARAFAEEIEQHIGEELCRQLTWRYETAHSQHGGFDAFAVMTVDGVDLRVCRAIGGVYRVYDPREHSFSDAEIRIVYPQEFEHGLLLAIATFRQREAAKAEAREREMTAVMARAEEEAEAAREIETALQHGIPVPASQPQPRIVNENSWMRIVELALEMNEARVAMFNQDGSISIRNMSVFGGDGSGNGVIDLDATQTRLLFNGYQAWMAKVAVDKVSQGDDGPDELPF